MPLLERAPNVSINPNPGQFIRNLMQMNQQRKINALAREKETNTQIFRNAQIGQANERLQLTKDAQEFTQNAPGLERERIRKENIDKANLVSGVQNAVENQFAMRPKTLSAILNSPEYKNILSGTKTPGKNEVRGEPELFTPDRREALAKQGELINRYIQQMRNNPQLHQDPNKIKAQIAKLARSKGYGEKAVAEMQAQAIEEFKVIDASTAKLRSDRLSAQDKNFATILSGYAKGRSGNRGTSGRGGSKGDANLRANQADFDSFLESIGATKGQASLVTRIFDKINFFNDTDVTGANVKPLFSALAEQGARGPGARQALEGLGYIVDGEFQNGILSGGLTPEDILANPKAMQEIIDTAKRIQNDAGNNDIGSQNQLSESLALSQLMGINSDTQFNQILSDLSPRARTGSERQQLALKYIKEQTGIPVDFNITTPEEKEEISKNFIPVKDTKIEDKVTVVSDTTPATGNIDNAVKLLSGTGKGAKVEAKDMQKAYQLLSSPQTEKERKNKIFQQNKDKVQDTEIQYETDLSEWLDPKSTKGISPFLRSQLVTRGKKLIREGKITSKDLEKAAGTGDRKVQNAMIAFEKQNRK